MLTRLQSPMSVWIKLPVITAAKKALVVISRGNMTEIYGAEQVTPTTPAFSRQHKMNVSLLSEHRGSSRDIPRVRALGQ